MKQPDIADSIQPHLSEVYRFKRFKGRYLLVGCVARIDRFGQPYRVIRLSDSSATVPIYCFSPNVTQIVLTPHTPVFIEASIRELKGACYIRCAFLEPVAPDTDRACLGITALPIAPSLQPGAVKQLVKLVGSLTNPHLQDFVSRVILAEQWGIPYLTCPASLRHHHNWRGGLLEHSLEVAKVLAAHTTLDKEQREIGIVAALLHDIGKTRTLTVDGRRTALGHLVDHDELTLEMCAPALARLDKVNSRLTRLLRHIWTCATPGSRYGYEPVTPIAEALQQADRESSQLRLFSTSE